MQIEDELCNSTFPSNALSHSTKQVSPIVIELKKAVKSFSNSGFTINKEYMCCTEMSFNKTVKSVF